MALGKAEGGLFGLLAQESANIFKSVSTALNGFGADRIQGHCGVFFDQLTETHNRAQRLWTTSVEGGSSPIAARLTQYRSTIDPIAAGGKNWSAQASCSQAPAELASIDAGVHGHLFHALVEDPYAAAVPAHPDLAPNKFLWRFVKGFFYFDVTIPMHTAPGFLEARKKGLGQRLQMRSFLFKTGSDLFAGRAMDPLVSDAAFPTL